MDDSLILFITFVASVLAVLAAFVWVALRLGPKGRGRGHQQNSDEMFSDDFREKLRARGIARFEKTLDQNAAFLQNDLKNIGEDVTEYIKERASELLKEEFADQKASVAAAQQHTVEVFASIEKTLLDYQKTVSLQFAKELAAEKQRRLQRFEQNMADVVIHHVQQTLGAQMKIDQQVEYILKQLENNKTAIVEDIKREI